MILTDEHTRMQHIQSSEKLNIHEMSSQLFFQIKLHGFLLWVSVGFLIPVAIVVQRMANREQSSKRLKIIFYFHVITQTLAVLLATAGTLMSIKYFDNSFNNDHQRIGLTFYAILWLQGLAGIIRPKGGSKRRNIWFIFHWLMGIVVSLLGIINIYTGLEAYHKRTSKDVRIWTILFTAEIFLIFFIYLIQEKWDYITQQSVVLRSDIVRPTDQEMSPRSKLKQPSYI